MVRAGSAEAGSAGAAAGSGSGDGTAGGASLAWGGSNTMVSPPRLRFRKTSTVAASRPITSAAQGQYPVSSGATSARFGGGELADGAGIGGNTGSELPAAAGVAAGSAAVREAEGLAEGEAAERGGCRAGAGAGVEVADASAFGTKIVGAGAGAGAGDGTVAVRGGGASGTTGPCGAEVADCDGGNCHVCASCACATLQARPSASNGSFAKDPVLMHRQGCLASLIAREPRGMIRPLAPGLRRVHGRVIPFLGRADVQAPASPRRP